ncbi:spore maturation protein CgeB [Lachnospiraceae bacterium C10]|nr:spore maturation protein CgeB [Lachnospiraceae bacterium C10]
MNILMYRYGSICEPDIIDTFHTFGFQVTEYRREMEHKNDRPSDSVKQLAAFIEKSPVDCIFSINFFPFVAEICQVLHLRYLCWIVDCPVMELYAKSITSPYNRIFLFDWALYNEIHPLNPDCVFHLPLAANTGAKDRLFADTTEAMHRKFSHPVAFVGSLYTEKSPFDRAKNIPAHTRGYLDGIMKAQESVYGYYFIEELLSEEVVEDFKHSIEGFYHYPSESFLTDKRTLAQLYIGNKITAMERLYTFRALSDHFPTYIYTGSDTGSMPNIHNMGFAKSLTEMPLIFHNSKININTTSKIIRTGLPLRIFDILSCGGFCLSNYQEEIPELFVPGEDLAVYTSLDEMLGLCEYYLSHEAERADMARSGYEKLKANYTYIHQLERLMTTAYSF